MVQIPGLILPNIVAPNIPTGAETEAITDLVEHTSKEIETWQLQEKIIHIMAVEVVAAGVPGNLQCWVELSPFPSTTSPAYWSAVGGGGGAVVPTAPLIIAGTGVNGAVHTETIGWVLSSQWARVVVHTPVSAALATAWWVVQVWLGGKSQ